MQKNKFLVILIFTCLAAIGCTSQEKKGELKEFNGHVTEITDQILKVTDNTGRCITFDNRNVTYIGGNLMKNDSVCVSYRGKLDSGTPSIIAEFIPKKK